MTYMKHAEPVSIILPTYNRADKLGDAIGSVLAQNYETFELLVIDDGSTDQTETLINSYEDKRVRYYRMEKIVGSRKQEMLECRWQSMITLHLRTVMICGVRGN